MHVLKCVANMYIYFGATSNTEECWSENAGSMECKMSFLESKDGQMRLSGDVCGLKAGVISGTKNLLEIDILLLH